MERNVSTALLGTRSMTHADSFWCAVSTHRAPMHGVGVGRLLLVMEYKVHICAISAHGKNVGVPASLVETLPAWPLWIALGKGSRYHMLR